MKSYCLTPAAEDDVFEIGLASRAKSYPRLPALKPKSIAPASVWPRGRDLTDKPVRFFAVRGTYMVVYDPASKPVEVLRVLHGARDVSAELK